MHRSLLAAGVLLTLSGPPGYADTEFEDSIPVEVAEVLFDTFPAGQFAIYSDLASDFPAFDLPPGFTVLGSVYQYNRLRAVLSSEVEPDVGIQLLEEAFAQQGWQDFPDFPAPMPNTGFVAPAVTPSATRRDEQLCHDSLGRLTIGAQQRDSGNYFSLSSGITFGSPQGDCATQIARQQQAMAQMGMSQGLRQYLPRMEVPEAENMRPRGAFIGGGSSSSANATETDINLNSDLDIAELFTHFAEQISAQDWVLDSESVGSRSATGNWTKSPEPDIQLVGTLSILLISDSNYELRFRLLAEGVDEVQGSIGIGVFGR